ncbi:MAG: ABC transporter permease [Acidovorax sp.]|uniref:ABC transporter permease n=1 Tax=Acidovorax sp. TaxID=1872122 RepID=UPI00261EB723|nr:ABC transporter permease [Acidovorax sp.]MDH4426151.1 ABC transporter permease [Acidovorax sp.]
MFALIPQLTAVWRARSLCGVLIRREVSARYAGTSLGVVWAYLQPCLTVAAYYLVFDVVFAMRMGAGAPTEAVGTYLIAGMLPWMAFADALARGMSSLVESAGVLQKNALPPMMFPVRSVLASALVFAPLLLLLVVAYAPLHGFAAAVLAFPLLVLAQTLLCALWGAVLAILAAALRDTLQVVAFTLSLGIFVSPVLFPAHLFPAGWEWVLWVNPMTPWVTAYQAVLLQGTWPPASAWLGVFAWLAAGAVLLEVLLRRCHDQLVDWL